jgi:RNA polymerase sigma factor for flagellar operon FliA
MGVFDGEYPQDLSRVLGHAKRLMKVLAKLERDRKDAWFVGRAAEIRGVVSLALADFRSGARDIESTDKALTAYIDTLHRGASKKLRCGLALVCCSMDDVITAVALDEARSVVGIDTSGGGAETHVTSAPTVPTGWVDSPEMLARVREGLAFVEINARAMVKTTGEAAATMDDLRAFGREGLLDAARSFDEHRGVPFERWASLRIRTAMVDGVRRWGAMPAGARRELLALEAIDSSPSDIQDSPDSTGAGPPDAVGGVARVRRDRDVESLGARGASPEDAAAHAELGSLLRGIVKALPNQERELVERSYFQGQTLDQAAASMGVSKSWASRVHARAIETMQRALSKSESGDSNARGSKPLPRRS